MITQLLQALEATPWGTAVRENTWLFPTIESIHVLALVPAPCPEDARADAAQARFTRAG